MSSLLSQATEYNSGDTSSKNRSRHIKTIKKHHDGNKKKNMETLMQLTSMSEDEDDNGLVDFKVTKPELTRTPHNYTPQDSEINENEINEKEKTEEIKNSMTEYNPNITLNTSLSKINKTATNFNHLSQPSNLNNAYIPSQQLQNSLNNIRNSNNNYLVETQSNNINNTSNINEQLNYIIHLLEEQQNSKTSTTTEELILYTFLGVFTIYIVDSFTKIGKSYTR